MAAAAGVPRTACATTIDEFVKEFADAQQARELTTLVAKVDAIGPAAFVTDLGLLENRFQFQRYLQGPVQGDHHVDHLPRSSPTSPPAGSRSSI